MPDAPNEIPLSSIDRTDRYRQEYKRIDKLAQSIKDYGLIQPIILTNTPTGYKLVAGGRRMAALDLLGITSLSHGLTSSPSRAGYVFQEEIPPHVLLELELEENLLRENTEWYEDVLQFKKIISAKEREATLAGQPWGQRQAGSLFGVSLGKANTIVRVAEALLLGDKEIQEAGSLADALRILLGRKEDEANRILAKNSVSNFGGAAIPGTKSPLDEIIIDLGEISLNSNGNTLCSNIEQNPMEPELLAPGFKGEEVTIPLSQMFFRGDFRDVMAKMPSESVDHILTDIPYGIDMDNLDIQNQERVEEEHDIAQNVELMPDFIKQAFRVVKDKGFVIFFYDLDWHIYLRDLAEAKGFKVQHWPFVWVKTHPCRNQAPGYNFTKSIETAMILRKGNATLNYPQVKGYIIEDGQVERKLYRNPFAKPFAVWKVFLDAVAIKGQTILDPFAGEMSSCRAVINCGMKPLGIELTEHHFNAGLEGIKSVYNVLTRNQAKFV